jgi:protein-S-isoprenylcysteine O-methyltransferase Ste14
MRKTHSNLGEMAPGFLTSLLMSVRLLHPLDPVKSHSRLVRAGAWLFRQRTWIPVPLFIALLVIPPAERSHATLLIALGSVIVVVSELLRLWAVHHVGVISRTRSDRLGPLIRTGPFAIVRNPLYLANIALWVGFALIAQLAWIVPLFIVVLGMEYHAIVLWEEQLLQLRRGEEYREYATHVPRWIPVFRAASSPTLESGGVRHSLRETLFSERGTLIAIGVGYLLLWVKSRL